jgi:hypothetical protein
MKKIEYRCNRCLIIEEKWYPSSSKPFHSIPCHKCGGLALRLPWSKHKEAVFKGFKEQRDNFG